MNNSRSALVVMLVIAFMFVQSSVSLATDISWVNTGTGDWFDSSNWDLGVPGDSDIAYVNNGGTAQINATIPILDSPGIYIGTDGTGTVEQFAGECLRGTPLRVGTGEGNSGTYRIGGTANVNFNNVHMGSSGGSAFWEQTGGQFDSYEAYVYEGARQVQSAGTHRIRRRMYFKGEYELSGTGEIECLWQFDMYGTFSQLGGDLDTYEMNIQGGSYDMRNGVYHAVRTYIGDIYDRGYSPTCQITGGTMDVGYLVLGRRGSLNISGGTLAISDSIAPDSPMTFSDGSWTIDVRGGIGDFTSATFGDLRQASMTSQPGSLTLLPAGFDVSQLASYMPGGLVHVCGSTLTVSASENISGQGRVSDHMVVYGNVSPSNYFNSTYAYIDAQNGVEVYGGNLNLGHGTLTVNDTTSSMSSGSLAAYQFYVGKNAAGQFIQTGGAFDDGDNLSTGPEIYVGHGSGSNGYYELSNGSVRAEQLYVGTDAGIGLFRQISGSVTLGFSTGSTLYVGPNGTYELQDGTFFCSDLYCGGRVTQTGGTMTNGDTPMASRYENGTYELLGGLHKTGLLELGKYRSSHATYRIDGDGELRANEIWVGPQYGDGTTGVDGQGKLEVAGGSISAKKLIVGHRLTGANEMNVSDPNASITLSKLFELGPSARFLAVPGTTIHMTGEKVENHSSDSASVEGLGQLHLIVEGGASKMMKYEVAGEDLGAVGAGFWENFALDTLTVGGSVAGWVQLIDEFDNQGDALLGQEALYLDCLEVGPGSSLDLNGLNIYYRNAMIDPTATILLNGGSLMQVPEPTTIIMMLFGAISIMAYAWRKRSA